MTFQDLVRDTLVTLRAHKLRTALTMFGIAWGIVSITLMVLDHGGEHLTNVRKVLSVLLHPVEIMVSAPFDISRNVSESMETRGSLMDKNRRLNQEALVQNARLQRMAALEAAAQRPFRRQAPRQARAVLADRCPARSPTAARVPFGSRRGTRGAGPARALATLRQSEG